MLLPNTKNRSLTLLLLLLLVQILVVRETLGQDSSLVWDKPVVVKRVAKPTRRVKPHRRIVEHVPLLTLEWRILKRNNDGTSQETNPSSMFHTGDRLRLAVKANQNAYLYIIHHSEGQDGSLIFPDSRINNGENYIKKDQEYILPAYCPTPEFEDPNDCWWRITPPSGREEFTIIFSRDMITNLPNQSDNAGTIKLSVIEQLLANSGQNLKHSSRPELNSSTGNGRYITWVTNTNARDNEDLIETIILTHGM